jgi:hypothetical protein
MASRQSFNLLISHNQLFIRAQLEDLTLVQWGEGNVDQGCILHPSYATFDPLVEGTFGAYVNVDFQSDYKIDPLAQRAISFALNIKSSDEVYVGSSSEHFKVDVADLIGPQAVVFEVCLADEAYYNFIFLHGQIAPKSATPLLDDGWGLQKGTLLGSGKF